MGVETKRTPLTAAQGQFPALLGEQLCLDFANIVEPRGGLAVTVPPGYPIRDHLWNYGDLVAWGRYAAILDEAIALDLAARGQAQAAAARAVFLRALALREAIYRVFWQLAEGGSSGASDLALLAAEHADGAAHAALVPAGDHFLWSWDEHDSDLARPLWPIAWSATALLTTGDPRRIKVCPGVPDAVVPCAWLFYDTTKNRIRHWCTMSDCGKKSKARRQTSRRRAHRGASKS
jgi:predicted RNA-binding Zn ribbon-like protein